MKQVNKKITVTYPRFSIKVEVDGKTRYASFDPDEEFSLFLTDEFPGCTFESEEKAYKEIALYMIEAIAHPHLIKGWTNVTLVETKTFVEEWAEEIMPGIFKLKKN